MSVAERRAQRLLRCYPRVWRHRYGDELVALLVDDLADRPRSWRRDLDVVLAGLGARLTVLGLTRGPVEDRSSAAALASVAWVCFTACALSIWTQLANGWLSAAPDTAAVAVSLVALSVWLGGLLAASVVVGIRLAFCIVRACRCGQARRLLPPLLTLASSGVVLLVGLGVVAATSPAAHGARRDGTLAHIAAIGWAATQSISTFWLHPHRLFALPATDIGWMVLGPTAGAAAVWSLMRLLRVTGPLLPRRDGSSVLPVLFLPCLASAAVWVIGSQHATNPNYRAGTLDLLLIAVMAAASCAPRRAGAAAP